MTQYLRKITVKYGQTAAAPNATLGPRKPWSVTSERDNDLRMQFRFVRSNTNRADSGTISIYNLPTEFSDSIHSGFEDSNNDRADILDGPKFKNDIDGRNVALQALAFANRVTVLAGYQDDEKLIFQGDIADLNVRSLASDVDTVTQISLGDSILTYKYGYLTKTFGSGASLKEIIPAILEAVGAKVSEQGLKFLDTNFPGVVSLQFSGGTIVQGGIQRNLDNLIAAYGVQWFMKGDEVFFMKRGDIFEDFSMRLDLSRNVLRPIGQIDGEDIRFRMLIDGDMVPGRGFRIFSEEGKPTSQHGYRADTIEYLGDTHGNPWYATVVASRIDAKFFLDQPFTPITRDEAFPIAVGL